MHSMHLLLPGPASAVQLRRGLPCPRQAHGRTICPALHRGVASEQPSAPASQQTAGFASPLSPQHGRAALLCMSATALLLLGQCCGAEAAVDGGLPEVQGSLIQTVQALATDNGLVGAAAFTAAYVIATVLFIPGSALTLAAGAVYGPVAGTAVVSVASTLGATAAFLVARTAARPWAESKLQGFPTAERIVAGVSRDGTRLVLLLRLSPLVPFTLLNYALGLTEVRLLQYIAASWAGMLPGTFAYVYLGSAGAAALDAAGGSGQVDPVKLVLWGVGAVATLAATKLIASAADKAMKDAPQEGGDS